MYLKSLKLVGFKSFADRTGFEFRPGVTVVVGPNGSGKSNIVDALSWVMGTQSTRALRTERMEDVIFAGTATRPALSRAEVTLVVDNTGRGLPMDLDEVALTRRLYRDGSSDYEINGVGCRLLDIQELLSDSGVGRHQHVIIGQGQVEAVLSASPADHRAVIEEAAGILKHRRRKEKAERRLERTDEDVIRLQDLLGEIERQMRPLRRQAKAAERYDGVKAEVRALVLHLAGVELAEIGSEMERILVENGAITDRLRDEDAELTRVGATLGRLTTETTEVGGTVERDTAAAALLETTVERIRRLGAIAQERRRALTGRAEIAAERRSDLEQELSAISSELEGMADHVATAGSEADRREAAFRRLEDEERAIATQTALSPEGAVAAVRGELSALEAASTRDLQEEQAVQRRLEVVEGQILEESAEISRINEEIRSQDEILSQLQRAYEKTAARRGADQDRWSKAEQGHAEARLQVAAAEARLEAIDAALAGRIDAEARGVAESAPQWQGSLVSALAIPDGLERAVEAALGPWAEAVVFPDRAAVEAAVAAVKAAGRGGVPLVSGAGEDSAPAPAAAREQGVDALIDRLGPGADPVLARRLLGDVLLVEGWSAAVSLVARYPGLRAVTPEGDLVTEDGVFVAHPDGAGPAMLEAAEVAAEQARTGLSRHASVLIAARRDFERSREEEREALERLETAEAALAGKTEAMARLQKSMESLEGERSRLSLRRQSLAAGVRERASVISDLRGRLAALEGEEADRARMWEEMEGRRLAIAAERESARSAWQEAAGALSAMLERKTLLEDRRAKVETELRRLESGVEPTGDAGKLELVEGAARDAVKVLQRRLGELRERQAGLRSTHRQALTALEEARSRHEGLRNSVAEGRERLAQLSVRQAEIRMRRERIEESVRRDADAEPDAAFEAPRPEVGDDVDLAAMLAEKTALLRRLGPINPLAAAEYTELEERHRFLADQLADVQRSRAEMRKVIRALEEEIGRRFADAFDEVSAAFQRYFGVLFPGGRGRIRLSDEGEEPGVMIEAQPLGKKVSHLSLLSGGERSLAALAFLFAVFEARPSPFYVLDEVEAALDDANLRRFLRIVDEFRQRAQLIIVTHQQQTMEAADVLYGVTMEPGGSSQAVRKEMGRTAAARIA